MTQQYYSMTQQDYSESLEFFFEDEELQEQIIINQVENSDNGYYNVMIHSIIKDLIIIQNKGPFTIAQVDKEVIVDKLCGGAVLRGADIFAQGLLAMSADISPGDRVSVYVDINGKCLRGSKPPFNFRRVHIGNGICNISRKHLYSSTQNSGIGVLMSEPVYMAPKLNQFLPELVFSQNLPSCLCGHVLDPSPGDVILDMCAAPGGKTCHIGSLMKNSGILIALDKAKPRISRLKMNVETYGIENAFIYCFDACKAVDDAAIDIAQGPPFPPESFDKILLDAPCSALGQRPSLSNKMTKKELESYPVIQKKLLSTAVKLLKPNGVLVYSTCTFIPEENELQIDWLLKQYPSMTIKSQGQYHLNHTIPGNVLEANLSLTRQQVSMLQWFHPGYIPQKSQQNYNNDTIGFFIAKLIKVV